MKLLVLGSSSQLGRELTRLLQEQGVDYATLAWDEVNFSDQAQVLKAVAKINPSQVINTSSFSSLEKAEENAEAGKQCDLVNSLGPSAIAEACNTLNLPLIHHSSSHVFDGEKPQPYTEEDESNPVSRYGLSRWYGERAIRDVLKQHIILRTDWLFSRHRNKFFTLHIEACKKHKGKIDVLSHRFSPTPASDVARVILAIARQVDCKAEPWGTYHYCALQPLNQEQFVESFLNEAAKYDKSLATQVERLEVKIVPVKVPYIANSALNSQKLMETFGIKARSRATGVSEVIDAIYNIKKPPKPISKPKPQKAKAQKEKVTKPKSPAKPAKKASKKK